MWCALSLPTSSPATIPPDCCVLFAGGGATGDRGDTGVMEVGERPAGVMDGSPSDVLFPPAHFGPGGPDCSEDVEENDAAVTERTLLPGTRTPGQGLGCSPGWALSFFGEDCFSPEVVEYAMSLGQHSGSAGLEVKTQVSDLMPISVSRSHDWKEHTKKCLFFIFFPHFTLHSPVALTLLKISIRKDFK